MKKFIYFIRDSEGGKRMNEIKREERRQEGREEKGTMVTSGERKGKIRYYPGRDRKKLT